MDRKYACYCGLYCENCAVKVKDEPAAKVLYEEMKKLGFEGIMQFFQDGEKFWPFLKACLLRVYVSRVRRVVEIQPTMSGYAQKKKMLICVRYAKVILAEI